MRLISICYVAIFILFMSNDDAFATIPFFLKPSFIFGMQITATSPLKDTLNGISRPTDAKNFISEHKAGDQNSRDDRPLLPMRPEDFDPRNPPQSVGDNGALPSTAPLQNETPANGISVIYIAQLSGYVAQLVQYARLLLALVAGSIFLFFVQILYQRSRAIQSRKSADTAQVSMQLAEYNGRRIREMSEKKMRAYVFTSGAKGELTNDKSGTYNVRVEIRNFGETPAYALSGWMTVFIDDFINEKEITSPPSDCDMVQTILPPGGKCFYYARTFHSVSKELKAIALSTRAIYAYGEVRYKDVFDEEHFARFRIKCSGERNLASGSFDHCIGGNEAN